jgi:hypothetical protein
MKEQQIESDIYVFIGETYYFNSTAFIKGDEVLLVDARTPPTQTEGENSSYIEPHGRPR